MIYLELSEYHNLLYAISSMTLHKCNFKFILHEYTQDFIVYIERLFWTCVLFDTTAGLIKHHLSDKSARSLI